MVFLTTLGDPPPRYGKIITATSSRLLVTCLARLVVTFDRRRYLNLSRLDRSSIDGASAFASEKLFNVEEQLLCRTLLRIEIGKEKAAASANLEAENFAAKRRRHHPGMRECFFDQ